MISAVSVIHSVSSSIESVRFYFYTDFIDNTTKNWPHGEASQTTAAFIPRHRAEAFFKVFRKTPRYNNWCVLSARIHSSFSGAGCHFGKWAASLSPLPAGEACPHFLWGESHGFLLPSAAPLQDFRQTEICLQSPVYIRISIFGKQKFASKAQFILKVVLFCVLLFSGRDQDTGRALKELQINGFPAAEPVSH